MYVVFVTYLPVRYFCTQLRFVECHDTLYSHESVTSVLRRTTARALVDEFILQHYYTASH